MPYRHSLPDTETDRMVRQNQHKKCNAIVKLIPYSQKVRF